VHEIAVALALVEQIEQARRRAGAAKVRAVHVRVGAWSGVVAEALAFAFPEAARPTLGDVALRIEAVPLALRCRRCGAEDEPEHGLPVCGGCGSQDVEVLRGRELTLARLEVE
jgi:hydrogenase nickel incorporation protein HypA/HybF